MAYGFVLAHGDLHFRIEDWEVNKPPTPTLPPPGKGDSVKLPITQLLSFDFSCTVAT